VKQARHRYFLTPPVLVICTAPLLPACAVWLRGGNEDGVLMLAGGWVIAFPLCLLWFMTCSSWVALYGQDRERRWSWSRALALGAFGGFLLGIMLAVAIRTVLPLWSNVSMLWSALCMGAMMLYIGMLGSCFCLLDPYFREAGRTMDAADDPDL
jgi:hypothetical protein